MCTAYRFKQNLPKEVFPQAQSLWKVFHKTINWIYTFLQTPYVFFLTWNSQTMKLIRSRTPQGCCIRSWTNCTVLGLDTVLTQPVSSVGKTCQTVVRTRGFIPSKSLRNPKESLFKVVCLAAQPWYSKQDTNTWDATKPLLLCLYHKEAKDQNKTCAVRQGLELYFCVSQDSAGALTRSRNPSGDLTGNVDQLQA